MDEKSQKLHTAVRKAIKTLDSGGTETVKTALTLLHKGGAVRNIHVGFTNFTPVQTMEWYAGQIVDILESESWFAVNSLINLLEKFCPEVLPK